MFINRHCNSAENWHCSDAVSYAIDNSISNRVKSNQILIVVTIIRLIWHQMEFRLVSNQSENGKYTENLVCFNNFLKKVIRENASIWYDYNNSTWFKQVALKPENLQRSKNVHVSERDACLSASWGTSQTSRTSQHSLWYWGDQVGDLNWRPIMPRDARLSLEVFAACWVC